MRAIWRCLPIWLFPLAALAVDVPSLPPQMCLLSINNAPEKAAIDYLRQANEGSNILVSTFADCQELAALRAHQTEALSHYGTVLEQTVDPLPLSRAQYVQAAAQIYAMNGNLTQQATQDALAKAAAANASLRKPTATSKGVLLRNQNVLIIGMEQEQTISGKPVQVASVAGATLIKGKPVSVNLYAPAAEKGAFEKSRDVIAAYVPKLIAANP